MFSNLFHNMHPRTIYHTISTFSQREKATCDTTCATTPPPPPSVESRKRIMPTHSSDDVNNALHYYDSASCSLCKRPGFIFLHFSVMIQKSRGPLILTSPPSTSSFSMGKCWWGDVSNGISPSPVTKGRNGDANILGSKIKSKSSFYSLGRSTDLSSSSAPHDPLIFDSNHLPTRQFTQSVLTMLTSQNQDANDIIIIIRILLPFTFAAQFSEFCSVLLNFPELGGRVFLHAGWGMKWITGKGK